MECTINICKININFTYAIQYSFLIYIVYIYIYTWAPDVRLHIAGTNESKSAQRVKQEVQYNCIEVTHATQSAQILQKQDEHNIYIKHKASC